MKIIKLWRYHERIIFLTELSGKYQLFYKSSGLAGHGSKGKVLPHLLLKADRRESPDGLGEWMPVGWITKYFVYDGEYQEYHTKQRQAFPEQMWPFLDELENMDLSDMKIEDQDCPITINNYCVDYIQSTDDYLDWRHVY